MSTEISSIEDSQTAAINQVRTDLGDLLKERHDDDYIRRFLVARKYDVNAAEQMLRKHIQYWNNKGADRLLTHFTPDKKNNYFFTALLGFDDEGSLVRLLRVGQSDLKGLVMSHTKEDSFKMAAYLLENDIIKQKQRNISHGDGKDGKMSYIIDLQGLQWRCLFSRLLTQHFISLLRAYEENYPERLKIVYIANAPGFFSLIFNYVKKILPADIISKIDVLSEPYREVLTRVMDPAILPAFLGGSRVDEDGDPTCPSLYPVPPGTPVPEEFYIDLHGEALSNDPEAKTMVILYQTSFTVKIPVDTVKSIIVWDFETLDNDIAMGLFLRRNGETEPESIIPMHKVDSHRYRESGRYECKEAGTYELLFDNTYSWWTNKNLTYKTKVLKPGEDDGEF